MELNCRIQCLKNCLCYETLEVNIPENFGPYFWDEHMAAAVDKVLLLRLRFRWKGHITLMEVM